MTKRRTPPRDPGADRAAALPPAEAEKLAAALGALVDDDEVAVEELEGTTAFLDALEELPPKLRARFGFKFRVVASEGPRTFLPDSEWGETVPTERAIAERYGPGVYTVEVKKRRKGQGGGWGSSVLVRIGAPRSPDRPAAPVNGESSRLWDLLERLLAAREDAADDAAGAPPALASQLAGLEEKLAQAIDSKDTSGIPPMFQPFVTRLLEKLTGLDGGGGGGPAPAAEPAS